MRAIKAVLLGATVCLALASGHAATNSDEGIAAFNQGRYTDARTKLKEAVAADSHDAKARLFLALTDAAQNDCASALPVLTANSSSVDGKTSRMAGLAAAKCYQAQEDNTRALEVLARLQGRFPNDADVLYAIAKLHIKAFNEATAEMYRRTPASYRVHELSAEIFEVNARFDEAVDEYKKAIALNSTAPDLHFRLGRASLMRSHGGEALEQAKSAFSEELKLSPEDAATEFQLGQIAQVQNDANGARAHWTKALALSPTFPEALIALGKLDSQAKQYGVAIDLFNRALKVQPNNEAAHYALMMAYRDNGEPEKAKAQKTELDRLQKAPAGEFTDFLKKLGEKPNAQ